MGCRLPACLDAGRRDGSENEVEREKEQKIPNKRDAVWPDKSDIAREGNGQGALFPPDRLQLPS